MKALLIFLLALVSCLFWTVEGQSVRLVTKREQTSPSLTAGRLEVLSNGRWGSVCNRGFDYREAGVACRQLGFSSYRNYGTVGSSGLGFEAASNSTPVWYLSCSSSSYSSLSSCRRSSGYDYGCTHKQDVVLSCLGSGALRLVGHYYSSRSSGRLEIYYNGQWGTVCDDFFDQTDADVACRQLGFASASSYGRVGSLGYSQGSGYIWLDNLVCTSTDFMLTACSHNGFGSSNCQHWQDVALSCSSVGKIRLVTKGEHTSSSLTAGRLEVYHSGQWGTVCSVGFYSTAAHIACRQLGFLTSLSYGTVGSDTSGRFDAASSSTPIWLSGLSCSSSDSALTECSHDSDGSNSCTHSQDVALFCQGNGALRLGGYYSLYSSSGRLEIYYNGQWGTVCSNSFGHTDANVACRQLGFASASNYGTVGSSGYSQGTGTIWLDNLQCTSSDLMLSTCSHGGFGNNYCSHSEDVAVTCSHSAAIRLVTKGEHTSSNLTAGRLEVYHSGQWGTVCDDGFYSTEASVACRQLGFSSHFDYDTVGSYGSDRFDAASSSTPIWLSDLSCSSSDYSLLDCSHDAFGTNYCTHSEDVSLFCLGNGALRLVDYYSSYYTTSTTSGRLEVYYNGEWGTVCDLDFDQTDANVACRQLGFGSATSYGTVGSLGFSQGYGTIWLNDLECTSSDFMLSACSHSGFGNTDFCSHSEDVAVSCSLSSTVSPTSSSTSITNLSFGAIAGIVIAAVIVFVMLIVSTVSCAIRARVRGSRLQNIPTRGTAPANSNNFPGTILMSSGAGASSSNFAYAPIPQEPPPPYPGTPTDNGGNNNNFSDFVAHTPQPQAQQAVSSHEHTQEHPTQPAPYATPFYPQPTAESPEGSATTFDTAAHQLHPESDNNGTSVQLEDYSEAHDQPPPVGVAVEIAAPPTVASVPPSDEVPCPTLSDIVHPPTVDDGETTAAATAAADDGDSDTSPLLPSSN